MDLALDLLRGNSSQRIFSRKLHASRTSTCHRAASGGAGSMATHGSVHPGREKGRIRRIRPTQATSHFAYLQLVSTPPRFQNFVLLVYFEAPLPMVGPERAFNTAGTRFR